MSKFSLTFSTNSPAALLAASAFLAALKDDGEDAPAAPAEPASKPRGRASKPSTESAPAETIPPSAPAVVATAAAPAPAAPVAAAAATPSEADVKKALIAVVTKVGKEACTALCVKHGSASGNFSGLDTGAYAAVIAEANALVEAAAAV